MTFCDNRLRCLYEGERHSRWPPEYVVLIDASKLCPSDLNIFCRENVVFVDAVKRDYPEQYMTTKISDQFVFPPECDSASLKATLQDEILTITCLLKRPISSPTNAEKTPGRVLSQKMFFVSSKDTQANRPFFINRLKSNGPLKVELQLPAVSKMDGASNYSESPIYSASSWPRDTTQLNNLNGHNNLPNVVGDPERQHFLLHRRERPASCLPFFKRSLPIGKIYSPEDILINCDGKVVSVSVTSYPDFFSQISSKLAFGVRDHAITETRHLDLPDNVDSSRLEAHLYDGSLVFSAPYVEAQVY